MTIELVPGTRQKYHLVAFDKDVSEREDDPDAGTLSQRVLSDLSSQPTTDVFLMSHGWKGGIPAAREQYNSWIKAMLACRGDISKLRHARLRQNGRRFCPLLIGIHWPSLPFGDEGLGGATSFDTDSALTPGHLIDSYAARISDTPHAREVIGTILESAFQGNMPETLSADLVAAYNILNGEARLAESGVGAAPGADREPFDAEQIYQDSRAIAGDAPVSFGAFRFTGLLSPLHQLSFWKMKDRARRLGESGAYNLLTRIQLASPNARVHLMGHSFGCIVMSAAVAGAPGILPNCPVP